MGKQWGSDWEAIGERLGGVMEIRRYKPWVALHNVSIGSTIDPYQRGRVFYDRFRQ